MEVIVSHFWPRTSTRQASASGGTRVRVIDRQLAGSHCLNERYAYEVLAGRPKRIASTRLASVDVHRSACLTTA